MGTGEGGGGCFITADGDDRVVHLVAAKLNIRAIHEEVPLDLLLLDEALQIRGFADSMLIRSKVVVIANTEQQVGIGHCDSLCTD